MAAIRLLLFWFLFLPLASATPAPDPGKKAGDIALGQIIENLQKTWDATKSYETSFKQSVSSKRMGTKDESAGTLSVIKPDKLRWESTTDGSIQIMNGKKLVLIQENRRRKNRVVDMYQDLSKAVDTRPLRFLAGKAKFKDVYNIRLVSQNGTMAELKLVPKEDASETLIAEIDKNSYFLRSLTTDSVDSKVRIDFSGIKTNVTLDDAQFEYKPKQKDVVHNQ